MRFFVCDFRLEIFNPFDSPIVIDEVNFDVSIADQFLPGWVVLCWFEPVYRRLSGQTLWNVNGNCEKWMEKELVETGRGEWKMWKVSRKC